MCPLCGQPHHHQHAPPGLHLCRISAEEDPCSGSAEDRRYLQRRPEAAAPDFLAAVTDLTASACEARNAATPDAPGVFYQSVMSYCRKAQHGKFPLNMTYPIVKHFDGLNDGLVAVDSAKWGDQFTLLEPRGHRGISHGDVVDLNRENIPGFDVREFYVSLVADLKNRGF